MTTATTALIEALEAMMGAGDDVIDWSPPCFDEHVKSNRRAARLAWHAARAQAQRAIDSAKIEADLEALERLGRRR